MYRLQLPTVGSGIEPDLLTFRTGSIRQRKRSRARAPFDAAPTAGGEFHPALKTLDCGVILALRRDPPGAPAHERTST